MGQKPGLVTLYTHGTDSTASVDPAWDRQVYGSKDRKLSAITVPIITLDFLISHYGRPDFLKIDVEGFEVSVLEGLSTKVPLLSFEFHARTIDRTEKCLSLLNKLGKLSMRASNMNCEWLMQKTSNLNDCLLALRGSNMAGDMFVWLD